MSKSESFKDQKAIEAANNCKGYKAQASGEDRCVHCGQRHSFHPPPAKVGRGRP